MLMMNMVKEKGMNNNNMIPARLLRAAFLALLLSLPAISHAETYSYDAAGRLTGVTYANGSSISYSYDANGNLLSKAITVVRAGLLDVDGNGVSDANDGVMILRRLNGAGTVTTGIVLPAGVSNQKVINNIDNAAASFDVDGNAKADANDGVMILRRLNGASTVSTGIALPAGVGGAGISGKRTDVELDGMIDGLK